MTNNTITIGDVCRSVSETFHSDGDVVLINTSDVLDGKILNHKYVPNNDLKGQFKKTFQKDDILFSEIRPQNRRFAYVDCEAKNYIASTKLMVLRVDTTKILPKFFYYYITNQNMLDKLQHIAETRSGTFPQITFSELSAMRMPKISLAQQEAVIKILKSLDDKIELNNKINDNLEQQAQAIFKSWFVDNARNFRKGTFSEIIEQIKSGDWGSDCSDQNKSAAYCIRGADIEGLRKGQRSKMPLRYILTKNIAAKILSANDIVVEISGGSPTQSTGRAVEISQALIDRLDEKLLCTNFCRAITPKKGYTAFLYLYWQYLYQKGVFFLYENGTTGIKNLDISSFIDIEEIQIPDEKLALQFDDLYRKLLTKICENGQENEKLAELRDSLLPKLMSGEIDVSNVKI